MQQRIIDQEYTLRVLPIARTVKDKFGALSGAVRQQMATNAAAVQMGGAAAALLVTYTFWNYISFPFLFTGTWPRGVCTPRACVPCLCARARVHSPRTRIIRLCLHVRARVCACVRACAVTSLITTIVDFS
ncbi:hypothetical protein EON67_09600 [archaeon]|nr:MAG: hypothetical protein EON67_09600 [archaeon]